MPVVCLVQASHYLRTSLLLKCIDREQDLIKEIWLLCSEEEDTEALKTDIPLLVKSPKEDIPSFLAAQCFRSSWEYVLLDDSIVHLRPGALRNLLHNHRKAEHRTTTCLTPLDFHRTGYLMQVMGILPDLLLQAWTPNYIDEYRFSNSDARAEAHEQYLMGLDKPHWGDFGTYHFQAGEILPETGYCWTGQAMQEIFQQNEPRFTNPGAMFAMIAKASGKSNALCGSAWAANLKKDMEPHYLHRYAAPTQAA